MFESTNGGTMREQIEINRILKQFYEISGFRISIHDEEFHEIYSYPSGLSPFCRRLQQNETIKKSCLENDAAAFRRAQASGEAFVYRCSRGLYEAVAPIYHYGMLSGYLMIGQVCDTKPQAQEHLIHVAEQILGNKTEAMMLAATVRLIPEEQIRSYLGIMSVIAEYITETASLHSQRKQLPQRIREYIDKNYMQKITLDMLSQKFHCSRSTLTKAFRREYGQSVLEYANLVRLKYAAKFIKTSQKSFKEIADTCGFPDQNYFSRVFHQFYGYSPTEYRKMQS